MSHLEQLFRRCDTKGSGYIDLEAFRDLCAGFEIRQEDADVIFADLDHDGDGRISFEDFSYGFRDFLTPGCKRGSAQLGLEDPHSPGPLRQPSFRLEKMNSLVEMEAKQQEMEKRHVRARSAWRHLADNLSNEDIKKFLNYSGDKIFSLYEELQTSEVPPHVMDHFQDLISALVVDVKKQEEKNKLLEERFAKERESHSAHLKSIEAELDAQMAKVEQQAIAKAKQEYDNEKRSLQSKMDAELTELQTQLRLFQKVDTWLNNEKDGKDGKDQKKLDIAIEENRNLKMHLNDTQTNIALLRAELGQVRNQYEVKMSELSEERENRMEYMYELENIHRQLDLLRSANQKLQDTNDGLVQMVDVNSLRSPRVVRKVANAAKRRGSGDEYDSDSLRSRSSRVSDRLRVTDSNFAIKRLLDDLDSGTSTLPAEDDHHHEEEPEEDHEEVAIRVLESVLIQQNSQPQSIEQRDRNLTEIDVVDHSSSSITANAIKEKPQPAPRKNLVRRPSALSSSTVNRPLTSSALSLNLEPTGPPDRTYKVVFAGDAAVGKTSFINRITKGVFLNNLSSTLGVDFQVKTIRVDERNIALQLWDTAGQERFRSVTRSYFRRADGVMLLYDVTNERSFLSVRQWIDAVDEVSEKRIPIMLCGNKLDLRQELVNKGCKCVSSEMGERVSRDHSATFLETSSKDGGNVIDALVQLSRDMCASEDTEVQTSILKIREEDTRKKSCCGGSSK